MRVAKFRGSYGELKAIVDGIAKSGTWSEGKDGHKCFRAKTGEILNWWEGSGTFNCQGANSEAFMAEVQAAMGSPVPVAKAMDATKIFLVHGHDRDARDQLELVLLRLGLQPFILQNSDGGGKTIVEALEQHIYKESAFGIVLLTPDDFGYAKTGTEADRQPRARQNVILEMGMVMAALGREKMAIIQKGILERPSDTDGILRIGFNDHVREIVPSLVQRLQAAGFEISAGMIAAASA
ncbi:DNA-binding protein [Sphingomonas sp. S-NIH.Pt1_0416]|jgi:predicted nucleotide-binding protein|uniref:DNA-binding protein n=1 Tax=Sphingomonas paucimobilis TaxID=13689 RepID=A0A411LMD2_SPHPI|nr:nucleotide-binding protein [Sphingomonas paucimobilis]NNG56691.1 DNA-binding protein [Sphingomonas paucimobilis]QBE93460.1 DNA-binding protein [Sphingomonas paucimobilis]RSU67004.1 DNA-binding protein [Sphingomonas sp. S-NIH.Pt1_0416]SUJ03549.1 Predicted nucleotide-binding protein containing TIR-like domain [Sphingomonas paucimobilis]